MILLLNSSYQVINTLARKGTTNKVTPYFQDKHIEDLSTGAETFTFSTFANTNESYNVQLGNYVAFPVENGYKLFQISEIIEEHNQEHIKTAYCEMAGIELVNEIIRATTLSSANLKQALTFALQDTEYKVGNIDSSIVEVHTIELKEPIKVYDFLQKYIIGKFGAEISFRVEIQGGRIVGKYIDCFEERGEFTGIRFSYGDNITNVKKTEDLTELATALVCIGKNGTTISSVDADDKPKGQDWIGDDLAYQQFNRNGSHIFDVFKFDTESPAELLREARKELAKRSKPKLKYEVAVELLGQKVNIGDTVYIVDNEFNPPLHLSARVSKLEMQRTVNNGMNDKVILANYKEVISKITDEDRDLASLIDERFPIKSNDISNGAVTGDKIPQDAINGKHVIKDSIKTEHLSAKSITSEKIEVGQVKAEHILAGEIKTQHLSADSVDASKIKADSIQSKHLMSDIVETRHLKADSIESSHIKADQVVSEHILAGEIKAHHLSTDSITSDKILAGAITTDKLEANCITSEKIMAGEIETKHLSAGSITSDKILANEIEAKHLKTDSITSDKVLANNILARHIKAGEIETDHLKAGLITSDKILAGSITSDKILSNQIETKHLKAGSVTADKVTTGELITNSAQIKTGIIETAHIGIGQITNAVIGKGAIGEANILDASITNSKIANASITSAKIGNAEIETAHIKELSANVIKSGQINTGLIEVAGTGGKLKIKDNRLQVFDKSATPVERVSVGDVNGDGTAYGLRVRGKDGTTILYDENGVYSEGITDGAITNPKIDDDSIDSRTLNLEELFVSDSAFIENLQATKIKASQLEVDEIRNDLINLSGLITFDSLNPELNDLLFIKDVDKTYINGNTILTNTIKASQIDLYEGLNVKKDGLDTFAVSTDGSVKVSGTIESFGFSNEEGQEKGYQLTPEGNAYLNDAVVRGSVILPSAGVTNYGGGSSENLLRNSSFSDKLNYWGTHDMSNNTGTNKNVVSTNPYMGSPKDCNVLQITGTNVSGRYGVRSEAIKLKPNTKYTISGYCAGHRLRKLQVNIWDVDNADANIHTIEYNPVNGGNSFDKWYRFETTFTTSANSTFVVNLYAIDLANDGYAWFGNIMLEEGEVASKMWQPHQLDGIDLVRFWAGASYEERNNAPFKVYESGKIVATEGEFGGTFTGELNIGNILIKDTNSTSAELSIRTNNNTKEAIRLTDSQANFDVDFNIGDVFKANVQTKGVEFGSGTSIDLNVNNTNFLELNKSAGNSYLPITIRGRSGGIHTFKTDLNYGGLTLESSGSQVTAGAETPYDFKFSRASADEDVNVVVKGNLVVDNKITMADNNKIELVSVSGANSGIDFMIR